MSNTLTKDKDELSEIAMEQGLECFFPEGNELQLDLDTPKASWNPKVASVFTNGITIIDHLKTVSKSGNTHIYIRLNQYITDKERLTLQAVLGSDPIKEALSVFRVRLDPSSYCSALFETPAEAERVRKWREPIAAEDEIPF